MSEHGIFHPADKGGVPASHAKCAKIDGANYSEQIPTYGTPANGCPAIDASSERLDAITNEVLAIAKKSGVKYDATECDNIARMICAMIESAGDDQTAAEVLMASGMTVEDCVTNLKSAVGQLEADAISTFTNMGGVTTITQADGDIFQITNDVYTIGEDASGDTVLLLNGNQVGSSVPDSDTVSPSISFTPNPQGGTDVLIGGQFAYHIIDEDTVSDPPPITSLVQTGPNEYMYFVDNVPTGSTINTIPDTDTGYVTGPVTVNEFGGTEVCLSPVWVTPPAGSAVGDLTGQPDACFTIPAGTTFIDGGNGVGTITDPAGDTRAVSLAIPLKCDGAAYGAGEFFRPLTMELYTGQFAGPNIAFTPSADGCTPEPPTDLCMAQLFLRTTNFSGQTFTWNPFVGAWTHTPPPAPVDASFGSFGTQIYSGQFTNNGLEFSETGAAITLTNPYPCHEACIDIQFSPVHNLIVLPGMEQNASFIMTAGDASAGGDIYAAGASISNSNAVNISPRGEGVFPLTKCAPPGGTVSVEPIINLTTVGPLAEAALWSGSISIFGTWRPR